MKGIECSECLYEQYLLPMIKKELPEAIPFLAAGLVGEGSECFGFDDEISSDHDHEVRLCIWLPEKQFAEYGSSLKELFSKLPDSINDCRVNKTGSQRNGIFEINEFYRMLTGKAGIPKSNREWYEIKMPLLAAAVNGKVFMDDPGHFTEIRSKLMEFYPEDVRLIKIAEAIGLAGQSGQYNYYRAVKRNDTVAAGVMKAYFAEKTAEAYFLLNKIYMPFYKWAYRKMKESSSEGVLLYYLLERLFNANGKEAIELIEKISSLLIDTLRKQGISDSISDFLPDHLGCVMMKIKDPGIRNRGVSLVR